MEDDERFHTSWVFGAPGSAVRKFQIGHVARILGRHELGDQMIREAEAAFAKNAELVRSPKKRK